MTTDKEQGLLCVRATMAQIGQLCGNEKQKPPENNTHFDQTQNNRIAKLSHLFWRQVKLGIQNTYQPPLLGEVITVKGRCKSKNHGPFK
jgi:hypothetical protein